MISTGSNIRKHFEAALAADKSYLRSFLTSWDYQVKLKKRGVKYQDELPQEFFEFSESEEILKWMNWFTGDYPNFMNTALTDPLMEASLRNDRAIMEALKLPTELSNYYNVGLNNAHDFLLPQLYPVPEEFGIRTVLDFGAGYGRQANLWWPHVKAKGGNFIGVDAIPLSYSLQAQYYAAIKPDYKEYIFEKDGFRIDQSGSDLYHLPTWRFDLIPDNSVDLVMCVQVLPEISSKLIGYLFKEFHRILKPGGAFYIRDLNFMYKAFGSSKIDTKLEDCGFQLEYRGYLQHNVHLHGIPRIWRKKIDGFEQTPGKHRKRYFIESIDAMTGGRLKRWKKSR